MPLFQKAQTNYTDSAPGLLLCVLFFFFFCLGSGSAFSALFDKHAHARTHAALTYLRQQREAHLQKKKKKGPNGAFNSRPPVRKRGRKDSVRCRACAVRSRRALRPSACLCSPGTGAICPNAAGNRDWPAERSTDRLPDFARACGFACTCSVVYSAIWYVRLPPPPFIVRQERPILCRPQHTAVRLAAQRAPSCYCRSHAHLCSALLPEKGAACFRGSADRLLGKEGAEGVIWRILRRYRVGGNTSEACASCSLITELHTP